MSNSIVLTVSQSGYYGYDMDYNDLKRLLSAIVGKTKMFPHRIDLVPSAFSDVFVGLMKFK